MTFEIKKYLIEDALLGAALEVVTEEPANIITNTGNRFVKLEFTDTQLLRDTVVAFGCGLELDAKKLLLTYRSLITRVKRCKDAVPFFGRPL